MIYCWLQWSHKIAMVHSYFDLREILNLKLFHSFQSDKVNR